MDYQNYVQEKTNKDFQGFSAYFKSKEQMQETLGNTLTPENWKENEFVVVEDHGNVVSLGFSNWDTDERLGDKWFFADKLELVFEG